MTDKEIQLAVNNVAYSIFGAARKEYRYTWKCVSRKRLRYCTAEVIETDNYFLLRSYDTLVAAIEKSTYELADVLRGEYGYTSTSAQHIAKFRHDYTPYPWNYPVFTYRKID